jgi:16S rRNA (cytosine967-C5)-methyltransferase
VPTPARLCAFQVVRRVFEQGAYADRAFRAEADRHELRGRDRAFAMRLAYGAVQRRATLDHLIAQLADRPLRRLDAPVTAALRLGLYQVVYMDGVADHAAVGESVELARLAGSRGHGLVNATLRRATREARALVDALGEATPAEAALRHSHPLWIAELWWEMLGGEAAVALMERDNQPPESALRANLLRCSREEVIAALAAEGVRARADDALVPEAVILEDPYDVHGSRLFAEGLVMPQSRASMLVACALDPQPGERVLDLCAAPGAKTTHIAALMRDEGAVVAVDRDPRRARSIAENARRLGAGAVEVREGDAREPAYGDGYDRVLVDPPCSDLGTLQARPDVRWRKSSAQIEELRAVQSHSLKAAASAVRPGGRLMLSTCTISTSENGGLIDDFLARNDDFTPVDLAARHPELASDGFLQTLPHRDATDGFFIAALERGS